MIQYHNHTTIKHTSFQGIPLSYQTIISRSIVFLFGSFRPCYAIRTLHMLPWQMNNTFIGISYLQNRIKLLQFAKLLKLQSFYRKSGQMAKSRKVWQILAVNRSQNVVFYRVKNYSCPGLQERGVHFSQRGGVHSRGGANAPP